jgi:hypothetical protein
VDLLKIMEYVKIKSYPMKIVSKKRIAMGDCCAANMLLGCSAMHPVGNKRENPSSQDASSGIKCGDELIPIVAADPRMGRMLDAELSQIINFLSAFQGTADTGCGSVVDHLYIENVDTLTEQDIVEATFNVNSPNVARLNILKHSIRIALSMAFI